MPKVPTFDREPATVKQLAEMLSAELTDWRHIVWPNHCWAFGMEHVKKGWKIFIDLGKCDARNAAARKILIRPDWPDSGHSETWHQGHGVYSPTPGTCVEFGSGYDIGPKRWAARIQSHVEPMLAIEWPKAEAQMVECNHLIEAQVTSHERVATLVGQPVSTRPDSCYGDYRANIATIRIMVQGDIQIETHSMPADDAVAVIEFMRQLADERKADS